MQPNGSRVRTMVGNLDSLEQSFVDSAGRIDPAGCSWSFDWWIGAEDRWHVPGDEAAVRQTLVGNAPVVETRVRVPSGDAVQRVYGARGPAGEDTLVIEVQNDSKVPFALALALVPTRLGGPGRVETLELDGTIVRVDGEPAFVLPRSPGRMLLATGADQDLATSLFEGAAEPVRPAGITCSAGSVSVALLFPLAHSATLRVALPLGVRRAPRQLATRGDRFGHVMSQVREGIRAPGKPATRGDRFGHVMSQVRVGVVPDVLPSADQVAAGWALQTRGSARFEVPERRLREALAASTRFLLLGAADPALSEALALLGFDELAAAALFAEQGWESRPGAGLNALATHWSLNRDLDVAKRAVPLAAELLPALGRSPAGADRALGHRCLGAVAEMLDAVGERRAANDVRGVAAIEQAELPTRSDAPASGSAEHEIRESLTTASSTWMWSSDTAAHDLSRNAALVVAVRRLLVDDTGDCLALSPEVPENWLGQGWEVHDVPTAHGRLSYAVRWHGERPALLWELEPHHDLSPARLSAPTLDPRWSSREPRGEALLAQIEVPHRSPERRDLRIPVSIEPFRGSVG